MQTTLTLMGLMLGLVFLVKGSDVFVEASAGLARNFKVPQVIIGMTIMAFGTSAPELFIGVRSAIDGTAALAMGNIVGSDIFNLIFILGFAAIVKPVAVDFTGLARDYAVAVLGPILLLLMLLHFEDVIPRIASLLFLVIFALYEASTLRRALGERAAQSQLEDPQAPDDEPEDKEVHTLKRNAVVAFLGLAAVILGGELVVHYGAEIATLFGMSPRIIGLTIVAIGTSLPELVIVLMASKRGENELAFGNIIGSSIFNVLLVLGLTGVVAPLPVEAGLAFDLLFLLGASAAFLVFVLTKKRLDRLEGLVLVLAYVSYLALTVLRG